MSEQTDPSQLNNEPQKLRPMGFGDLLDAIFSLYRAHFLPFLAIASGYFIAILIVISIVFLDDSVGRGAKIAIWISTVSATFGVSVFVVSGLVFAGTEAYLSRNIRVGAALKTSDASIFTLLHWFAFIRIARVSLRIVRQHSVHATHTVLYKHCR